jgi:hypothetical protein
MKYNETNKLLNNQKTKFKCDLCEYYTYNVVKWRIHLDSTKHKKFQYMTYDDVIKSKKKCKSFNTIYRSLCFKFDKYFH